MFRAMGIPGLENSVSSNSASVLWQPNSQDDEICKSLRNFANMVLSKEGPANSANKENLPDVCDFEAVQNYQSFENPGSIWSHQEQNLPITPQFSGQTTILNNRVLNTRNNNQMEFTQPRRRSSPISSQKSRNDRKLGKICVFCVNNNESDAVARSHSIRDKFGRVLCPKLRVYTCPICKASGDDAHTLKYCPKKNVVTMQETIARQLERNQLVQNHFRF